MKQHSTWIIVTVVTLVVLVGLHFTIFAPMSNNYQTALGQLDEGVQKLKSQIDSVDWNIPRPDPRDSGFTWDGLLDNVKGNYEGKKVAYENLVEDIAITMPGDDPEKSRELVLSRLSTLQQLEEKNRRVLHVSDKWGLNTVSDQGQNGSRPLDLRRGGYRAYAGESRLDAKQGTIQFAINPAAWIETGPALTPEELLKKQAEGPKIEVLFHAGKKKPPAADAPKGAPPEYSSEIIVQRESSNITILLRTREAMNEITRPASINIADWLRKDSLGNNPWKVIRFTWGPVISDIQTFVEGKTTTEFNATVKNVGVPGAGMAMGGGMPYGGGMMGMMGMGMRGGMMGGEGGMMGMAGGGGTDPNFGISLEPMDTFTIGCDLQYNNPAEIMYDSFRIWNSVAKSGSSEPQGEPLFSEDFEKPFGDDNELKRSIDQLKRYYRETYDPVNSKDVQKANKLWFDYLSAFWGGSPGMKDSQPDWLVTMRTLAFLDYAGKKAEKTGDPDRLARDIGLTVPEHNRRAHVATFLDLVADVAATLVDSKVDMVDRIDFLTWSNTVNDEPLKIAYKEAFDKLEADVTAAGGMMKGGMMGMGMMGMGMMGMGYGMPYGGGGYGGMPGMYSPMMAAPAGDGDEAENPDALKEAQRQQEEMMKQRMEEMEKQLEKMAKLEDNRKKWQRWVQYNKKKEIPPEFYTEYQEQMATMGKNFFRRYSLQTEFECSKDRLAPTLHAIEFGKRLAFISKLQLNAVEDTTSQVHAIVNIEYNFMDPNLFEKEEAVQEGTEGVPAEGETPPAEEAQTAAGAEG